MKRLVAILALLVAASGCAPRYGENWRPVSEAGLRVVFPGEPAKQTGGSQTSFTLNVGGETFFASYVLGGPMTTDAEQYLDQLRNGFVKTVPGGTLVGERPVSADGVEGREITVDAPGYGREVVARFYVSKSITYSASVARPKERPLSEDGQMFLDSVEVESR